MNHKGLLIDSLDGYNIIECEKCNFKHLDPIPSDIELEKYYSEQYYQISKPNYLKEDRIEIDHRNIFFDQRINFFKKNIKGKLLLDIGCGDGIFMQRALEKGFEPYGIEPSDKASSIAISNNLNIFKGTLENFIIQNNLKFDIVHLKNVLEHVNRPSDILEICNNLLNHGGILYIEVPNDYNLFQTLGIKINKEIKSWICIPDHINYFNFNSLKNLIRSRDFKIIKRDTTFPMYFFLIIGLNFIKNKKLGKKLHGLRVKFELLCAKFYLNKLRQFIYWILAILGLGRTVIFYAKKTN